MQFSEHEKINILMFCSHSANQTIWTVNSLIAIAVRVCHERIKMQIFKHVFNPFSVCLPLSFCVSGSLFSSPICLLSFHAVIVCSLPFLFSLPISRFSAWLKCRVNAIFQRQTNGALITWVPDEASMTSERTRICRVCACQEHTCVNLNRFSVSFNQIQAPSSSLAIIMLH